MCFYVSIRKFNYRSKEETDVLKACLLNAQDEVAALLDEKNTLLNTVRILQVSYNENSRNRITYNVYFLGKLSYSKCEYLISRSMHQVLKVEELQVCLQELIKDNKNVVSTVLHAVHRTRPNEPVSFKHTIDN